MKSDGLGRIAVVGAGAVGGYYGAMLARSGQDVAFLFRSDYRAVCENGLRVVSDDGEFSLAADEIGVHAGAAEIGEVDLVIVATKATANVDLPGLIRPLCGERTAILTLQNGLGNDDWLARHFGSERILGGLCFVCLNRIEPGVVRHMGEGRVTLGEYGRVGVSRRLEVLAEAFERAGVPARAVANLAAAQWRKLVWNIPFNGLAIAAGGLDCAAILAEPALEARVRELMAEVVATGTALGYGEAFSEGLVDKQVEATRAMGAYRSSSLIDFLEGRPVELEAIWGKPLAVAKAKGVEMPALEKLHRQIRTSLA